MENVVNDGQIKYTSAMGQVIASYAQDIRFKNYLEIGTWNGGGSTYCFAKGFEHREEPFYFLTLEINKELFEISKEKYKNIPYVRCVHGSIISTHDISNTNMILERFENLNMDWLRDDLENLANVSHIKFDNVSPDVVLLDGSEYLTYFEFMKLRDTTKVFILDDINTEKCREIVQLLDNSSEWIMKHKVTNERNGWAVYEKNSL
jgi:hypothetical protein